jgi:hypothetical protein
MRSLFSKLLLLALSVYCLTSCDPDDIPISEENPKEIVTSNCCAEQGELPSEPGEEEEEEEN